MVFFARWINIIEIYFCRWQNMTSPRLNRIVAEPVGSLLDAMDLLDPDHPQHENSHVWRREFRAAAEEAKEARDHLHRIWTGDPYPEENPPQWGKRLLGQTDQLHSDQIDMLIATSLLSLQEGVKGRPDHIFAGLETIILLGKHIKKTAAS
jgi:hypothetical protein